MMYLQVCRRSQAASHQVLYRPNLPNSPKNSKMKMVVTVFGVSVKVDSLLRSCGEVCKGTQFDRRGVHGHWGSGSVVSFMPVQSDEVFVSHFLKCSHVIIGLSGGMKEKSGPFFCFVYRSKLFQDGFDIVLRPSLVPRFVSHTIRCVAYEQTY